MRALRMLLLLLVVATLAAAPTGAEEDKFPPPDLGPNYVQPKDVGPPPAQDYWAYIDIAALVSALGLTSFVTLKLRSRRGVFVIMVASLIYFGFVREGCICPIGAIQNVTMAAFDASYEVPVVVVLYFFIPLITTIFFGRTFCAAVCPLGAIQDVMLVKPYRIPPALSKALGMLRYVYLGAAMLMAATASAFIICQYDPFIAFFRLTGEMHMLVLGGCFLFVGMFVGRPYCRFFCPYGVLLGWMSMLSKWRITITPSECVNCRLCEEKACPFEAISMPTTPSVALDRYRGRLALVTMVILLPILVIGGAWMGTKASGRLARMNYHVRVLDRLELEQAGKATGTSDLSDSFKGSGVPLADLEARVGGILGRFKIGSAMLFAFIGLVIGIKLIAGTIRRTQVDYEADREACYACARCYEYCPVEQTEGVRGEPLRKPSQLEFSHVCSGS